MEFSGGKVQKLFLALNENLFDGERDQPEYMNDNNSWISAT